METIYLSGKPCHTFGTLPRYNEKAPCFTLVDKDLNEISCSDYKDKRIVMNIFPSLDTPVCAASVHRFNAETTAFKDTVVICISMDLPFALQRFCLAEGTKNVILASAFRSLTFARKYGLEIIDGKLAGLLARAVIILDDQRKVIYTELVTELTREPNYTAAIAAILKNPTISH
jgi:thiol peroxidase